MAWIFKRSSDWPRAQRWACTAFCIFLLPSTNSFGFPAHWATIILAWAAVTSLFSISVVYSLAAVFGLACATLFVPAALSQLGSVRTVNSCLAGLLFFVALNWILHFTLPNLARSAFVMPNHEIVYRFGNDSQQLGLQIVWALGLLLMLVFAGLRTWRYAIVPIVVLVGTLPLTQARAPAAAAIAVTAVVIWRYSNIRQRVLSISMLLILFAGACFVAESGVDFTRNFDGLVQKLSRSGQIDELKNFTGRVEIWEYAWKRCVDAPIFGYGYGASRFALQEDPNYPLRFQADHAHNLYLNVTLTMGLPGLLLLVGMIGHMLFRNLWRPNTLVSIVLTVIVITSITESLLYGPMPRSHTVVWLIAMFWQQMHMDPLQDRPTIGELSE